MEFLLWAVTSVIHYSPETRTILIGFSLNQYINVVMTDSPAHQAITQYFTQLMHTRLNNDPALIKKFMPSYPVGCRRGTPGDTYLKSLLQPNAAAIFDPILRITENGIETENGEGAFDIVVCATGFDVSFSPHWEVVGRNGKRFDECWREGPQAYLGTCVEDMPSVAPPRFFK